MINLCDLGQVYLVCGKTDLRKGIDGLATVVAENHDLDLLMIPYSSSVIRAMIDLRDSIGTVKDSSCFINVLKMVVCAGHGGNHFGLPGL